MQSVVVLVTKMGTLRRATENQITQYQMLLNEGQQFFRVGTELKLCSFVADDLVTSCQQKLNTLVVGLTLTTGNRHRLTNPVDRNVYCWLEHGSPSKLTVAKA